MADLIVVGLDDQRCSESAARAALELAAALGCEVHAVHVNHVGSAMMAALAGVPGALGEASEAQRSAVWRAMGPVLSTASVPVRRVDLDGYPPDRLTEYAAQVGASVLVVGTRGRGELAALLLGSTSHRVVNQATCNVLVTREEEER